MSSNKMTPEDIESLFKESYTTIFCSHNKDGTIHAAPIWYRYREGVFYFVSIKSRRYHNVQRNADVSLSFLIQGTKTTEEGDTPSRCALVYGKAEQGFEPEEGYVQYSAWIFSKYYPEETELPSEFNHENFVTLRVVPEKIVHFYP